MHAGGSGKVVAQPLGARLANMQRGADGAHRGNLISYQFSRATPSTASAVDHLITRSTAFTAHRRLPAETLL